MPTLANSNHSLDACYDLVSLYYGKRMYSLGDEVLNNIPNDFNLTPEQFDIYSDFQILFDMIKAIDESPNGLSGLTSTQINTLATLSENDYQLPGAYARNLLVADSIIQYEEPILQPSPSVKSKRNIRVSSTNLTSEPYSLKVYPNPANEYIVVEYQIPQKDLTEGLKCWVKIYDMFGHEVLHQPLGKVYDQFIINCKYLPVGAYIVSLQSKGVLKKQAKIIIQK